MTRLVGAELLKLRTTRLLLWLGLMILALIALIVSLNAANRSLDDLAREASQRDLVMTAAIATLISLILGIVVPTAEYAHNTIGATFLVAPLRGRVVWAKAVAAMCVGALLAAFAWVVAVGLTAVWLWARSVHSHLWSHWTFTLLLGLLLASALTAATGVGFGALLRRQTPAIIVALVWLLVGEPLLGITSKQRYAPGHAIVAVAEAGRQGPDLLHFWPGLLVSLGYAALLVAAGTLMVTRSDVT